MAYTLRTPSLTCMRCANCGNANACPLPYGEPYPLNGCLYFYPLAGSTAGSSAVPTQEQTMSHEQETKPSIQAIKDIHHVAFLQENWTTVGVIFHEFRTAKENEWRFGNFPAASKKYTYRIWNEWNIKVGDLLLVPVGANEELKVVQVAEVHDLPELDTSSDYVVRWALGKLNNLVVSYEAQAKREKEAVQLIRQAERFARHKEILKSLEEGAGGSVLEKARTLLLGKKEEGVAEVKNEPAAKPDLPWVEKAAD